MPNKWKARRLLEVFIRCARCLDSTWGVANARFGLFLPVAQARGFPCVGRYCKWLLVLDLHDCLGSMANVRRLRRRRLFDNRRLSGVSILRDRLVEALIVVSRGPGLYVQVSLQSVPLVG